MKCPKCKKAMDFDREDETENTVTNKIYLRRVYVCKSDDVWVTIEKPKE